MLPILDGYIDLLNKLSICFFQYGILTFEEAEKIEQSKSDPLASLQIVSKMNEYLTEDSRNCIPMLKALIENDQTHIAKFIVTSGKNTRSPDRVLRKDEIDAIDGNMFCLDKLVWPRANHFLVMLVEVKCITANHKNWIIHCAKKKKDVYQLFEILKRRSFTHYTDFVSCLQMTGHTIILDVLKKGGVVEITNHLKGFKNRSDRKTIEKGIISQLCGYIYNKHKNILTEEMQSFIDRLINLLNKKKNKIKFIACYPTHSVCLYFQCETDVSQEWLVDFCKYGGLKEELKSLFQLLQPTLNSYSNFDIDVSMTKSSKIHSFDTAIHSKSGN